MVSVLDKDQNKMDHKSHCYKYVTELVSGWRKQEVSTAEDQMIHSLLNCYENRQSSLLLVN